MAKKPTFPVVYDMVREELQSFPDLAISNPNPSEWVYFRFPGRPPGVAIRYRLPDHVAELVVKRIHVDEAALQAALHRSPLPGASVSVRGETEIAVWISTPTLDFSADGGGQRDRIRSALEAIDSLRVWYLTQGGRHSLRATAP